MFANLTNVIGKIKYALYGVKLIAQNFIFSLTETFVLLITCVVDAVHNVDELKR